MKLSDFSLWTNTFFGTSYYTDAEQGLARDEEYGSALIQLAGGKFIRFKATIKSFDKLKSRVWSLSLTGLDSLMIYLHFQLGSKFKEADHTGYIVLCQLNSENILGEKYASYFYSKEKYSKKGQLIYNLNETDDVHLKGTFSGTLYSESGKKLLIDHGKFNIPRL